MGAVGAAGAGNVFCTHNNLEQRPLFASTLIPNNPMITTKIGYFAVWKMGYPSFLEEGSCWDISPPATCWGGGGH